MSTVHCLSSSPGVPQSPTLPQMKAQAGRPRSTPRLTQEPGSRLVAKCTLAVVAAASSPDATDSWGHGQCLRRMRAHTCSQELFVTTPTGNDPGVHRW